MTIFLAVFIPVAYLLIWAQAAQFFRRVIKWRRDHDSDDRAWNTAAAMFFGFFWPVSLIGFGLALYAAGRNLAELYAARRKKHTLDEVIAEREAQLAELNEQLLREHGIDS